MHKIIFFEVHLLGLCRYPFRIISNINNSDLSKYEFLLIYEEDPTNLNQELSHKLDKLNVNYILKKINKVTFKNIKNIILYFEPTTIFVMAQRIPDTAFVTLGNHLGIKTIMMQHGLYIPFMKRDIKFFISKLKKLFRYILYSFVISKTINKSYLSTLFNYFKVYYLGYNESDITFPHAKMNAKEVLIYGEYWKEYHVKKFSYDIDSFYIIGYPDYVDIKSRNFLKQKNTVCYIAQSLVEDGRLPREQMLSFVKMFSKIVEKLSLQVYIKPHPRSDMSLYSELLNSGAKVLTNELPDCNKFIGHYSSLLAMASFHDKPLFLYKFHNHNEYPEYFIDSCDFYSNSYHDLFNFLSNTFKDKINKKSYNVFSYRENIYKLIINRIN